jgi:hypothetical protein
MSNRPAKVMEAVASLIFSAGEDIVPFAPQLISVVFQGAGEDDEADCRMKANSIETLSNLVRFASDAFGDDLPRAIDVIVQAGLTTDFDVRTSVFASLSNVLLTGVDEFADHIQTFVNACFAEEIQSGDRNDDEEDFVGLHNQINSLTNALLLVKNIFKRSPALLPANPGDWVEFSVNCMESFTDDLSVAATLAATYGVLHCGDYPPFYEALAKLFENESGTVVGAAFRAVCRFVDAARELPAELMARAVEYGRLGLRGKLMCQDSEASRFNLQTNLYRFFAAVAAKFFDEFPLALFVDHSKRVKGVFEMSQYIGVLRQLYQEHFGVIPGLTKKLVIRMFVKRLAICDGSVIPEPILAIRAVLTREPQLLAVEIPAILEFVAVVLGREYLGEPHYWATVMAAISLVCTAWQVNGVEIDWAQWIPLVLAKLPVRGGEMEAENIFATLVALAGGVPQECLPNLVRVYVQTCALTAKVLESFHLQEATWSGIVTQLGQILAEHPELDEVVEQALGDQPSRERFVARTAPRDV